MAEIRKPNPWLQLRGSGIVQIAGDLPLGMVRRALRVGLAEEAAGLRGQYVRALHERMHLRAVQVDAPDEQIDAKAFELARDVVAAVAGGPIVDKILPATRLVWSAPELGHWVGGLLPRVTIDAKRQVQALEMVAAHPNESVRARALALLASLIHLDKEAVRAASEILGDSDRAKVLAILGMKLPRREQLNAMEVAERIASPQHRAAALAALAPYSFHRGPPVKRLLRSAVEDVAELDAVDDKASGLVALTPAMKALYPDLLQLVREASASMPPSPARDEVEEAVALPSPQAYQPVGEQRLPASAGASEGRSVPLAEEQRAAPRRGVSRDLARPRNRRSATTGRGRFVNMMFAGVKAPTRALAKTTTLRPETPYFFVVDVGALKKSSIVKRPKELPPLLGGAQLDVVLFSQPEGFMFDRESATGALVIDARGSARVARQPMRRPPVADKHRLFFQVTTPRTEGAARLRCNLYCKGNLLQSHLVSAQVSTAARESLKGAQNTTIDYTISQLDAAHLAGMAQHRLSVMLNRSADGSHDFMFYGPGTKPAAKPDFQHETVLSELALKKMVDMGRSALRRVAWGNAKPWTNSSHQRYRYASAINRADLFHDLVKLAVAGYRMYRGLIKDVAGGRAAAAALARLMQAGGAGLVQLALKEKAEHVFPAALLYDYDIDTNEELTLCPAFREALGAVTPLDQSACFLGRCPSRGRLTLVCPSGFWGYRHSLGLPLSTKDAPPVPLELQIRDGTEFTVLVSTDPQFVLRVEHLKTLKAKCIPKRWCVAETRSESFTRLKTDHPHLVYFYGHGGVTADKLPYIEVGPPDAGGAILSDNLPAYKIEWSEPRPLVFLNGCHTAALEPEVAINLVSAFVEDCFAAGVVGTEITIFEPLACRFAEECLKRFFVEKTPIGDAVRLTRLALLQEGNPLGLVYIPYVHAGLRVAQTS